MERSEIIQNLTVMRNADHLLGDFMSSCTLKFTFRFEVKLISLVGWNYGSI